MNRLYQLGQYSKIAIKGKEKLQNGRYIRTPFDIYIYIKHVKDNTRYCSWIYKILKHTVRIHNTASCLWGGGWESMGLGIHNKWELQLNFFIKKNERKYVIYYQFIFGNGFDRDC